MGMNTIATGSHYRLEIQATNMACCIWCLDHIAKAAAAASVRVKPANTHHYYIW